MSAADIARLDVPAAELAAQLWNDRHPVGTPVIAYPGCRPEDDPRDERLVTTTRSKAQVLGGHTAVVCIALTHVDVDLTAAGLEAARLRLPLDHPDRHALDLDVDRQFAALAAQWGGAS
jgi:hypothetical protein